MAHAKEGAVSIFWHRGCKHPVSAKNRHFLISNGMKFRKRMIGFETHATLSMHVHFASADGFAEYTRRR